MRLRRPLRLGFIAGFALGLSIPPSAAEPPEAPLPPPQIEAERPAPPAAVAVSAAAKREQARLCSKSPDEQFPPAWKWNAERIIGIQPRGATLTDRLFPKIEQVRRGKVIATYTQLGGKGQRQLDASRNPSRHAAQGLFSRFGRRLWRDGDTFLVYPAVYSGPNNQLWLGPMADIPNGPTYTPTNITLRGVTVNGIRPVIMLDTEAGENTLEQGPVYFAGSRHLVFENIDVGMVPGGHAGKAGIYVNGAADLTLRNLRVHGFQYQSGTGEHGEKIPFGANGIIVSPASTGTLTLDHVELFENGSSDGPSHNIYVSASAADPNFTVRMANSWSHDAFYGHLFKSRAQVNILENNFFEGGLPQGEKNGLDFNQAENWLVDIPQGGRLTLRGNILVKNASGPNSNGGSVTFGVEGIRDGREQQAIIENNTFVALEKTYDGKNPAWPFYFLNHKLPGTAGSILAEGRYSIADNVFVGYCSQGRSQLGGALDYRGDPSFTRAFRELNPDYTLKPTAGRDDE